MNEDEITFVSESTRIRGTLEVGRLAKIFGSLVGEIQAATGSTVILGETAFIEGDILCDTLFINGFVRGNIKATTRVVVSCTGRVIGNIESPKIAIDTGGHFEGRSSMEAFTASL